MEKLAIDIIKSAESGEIKNSVVRYFMDDNLHEYVRMTMGDKLLSGKFSDWKEYIKTFLTIDWVFDNFVAHDLYMGQTLSTIDFWKAHPNGGGKDAFLKFNNNLILRNEIQKILVKKGLVPKYVTVKYVTYARPYFYKDKAIRGYQRFIIRGDLSIRELFTRAINKVSLCNGPEYTRSSKYRHLWKISSIRSYDCYDYNTYTNEFYKVYINVCNYYGMEPVI
jgi:hypothetical protein